MRILEIIHLRSAASSLESLSARISESVKAVGDDLETVTVYRRDGFGTDLAVHVRHSPGTPDSRSELGLRLASELKAFGLVVYSVWEEL